MELLKHLKELDKMRADYEKLSVEEAVKKVRGETNSNVELIHRVASFLSCIRDEKLESSRRRTKEIWG